METTTNPFVTGVFEGREYGAVTATDRIDMLRRFDAQQCRQVLAMEGLATTVRQAAQRRLCKLEKGQEMAGNDREKPVTPEQKEAKTGVQPS